MTREEAIDSLSVAFGECRHYKGGRCTAHNSTVCVNTLFSVRNGYQKPNCPDFTPKTEKQ